MTFGSAASTSFAPKNRGKAVKNLDPDGVSRGEGGLELEDATYEKALLRTLFEYARAGRLDAAFDLCHQTDQSWRAATLRGAMLYHDPNLSFDLQDVDRVVGNRNRSLWKSACRKLAANPNLDEFERALYGSWPESSNRCPTSVKAGRNSFGLMSTPSWKPLSILSWTRDIAGGVRMRMSRYLVKASTARSDLRRVHHHRRLLLLQSQLVLETRRVNQGRGGARLIERRL